MAFGSDIGKAVVDKELRQCWTTQPKLFQQLNKIFQFTIDACASEDNALCKRYWSKENDCRKQDWSNEIVFCNPPFGDTGTIISNAPKATNAVFLLPVTCLATKYFEANPPSLICIPNHRIRFDPPKGLKVTTVSPTLGTVILIYGKTTKEQKKQLESIFLVYNG